MTRIRLPYIHEYIDITGAVRRDVRRRGFKKVPLPGLPGWDEFMRAYQEAIAGAAPAARRSHKDGTVADLVTRYDGSPKFDKLSESSKAQYREQLDRFVIEHGHRYVLDLTADKAEKVIVKIGTTRPGLANKYRAILSAVFRYAVRLRLRADNPFSAEVIDAYKLGSYRSWTDGEMETYRKRWPLGTRERLAYAVLLYTGQRISDAIKLTRSDVFSISQKKTGAELQNPEAPCARARDQGRVRRMASISWVTRTAARSQITSFSDLVQRRAACRRAAAGLQAARAAQSEPAATCRSWRDHEADAGHQRTQDIARNGTLQRAGKSGVACGVCDGAAAGRRMNIEWLMGSL